MLVIYFLFDFLNNLPAQIILVLLSFIILKRHHHIIVMLLIIGSIFIGIESYHVKPAAMTVRVIHPNYTIVGKGSSNIVIWDYYPGNLNDIVLLNGYLEQRDRGSFEAVNRIAYQMSKANITTVKQGQGLRSKLWNLYKDKPMVQALLFNQSIEGLPMLSSLSLQVSGSLLILLAVFRKYLDETSSRYVSMVYCVLYIMLFGLAFSLLRIALQKFIKKEYVPYLLLLLYPGTSLSFHFLFPYLKVLLDQCSIHFKKISFKALIPILSLVSSYSFSIAEYLMYPLFKIMSGVFLWMLLLVPFSAGFIQVILNGLITLLNLPIMNVFRIVGKPSSILLFLVLVFYYYRNMRIAYITLGITLVLMLFPLRTQVVYVDVGQGDATLIQTVFNQRNILIDTGKASQYKNLKRSLNKYGVKTIDEIIITHDDEDHSGGLESVLKDFKVKHVAYELSDVKYLQTYDLNKEYGDINADSLITSLSIKSKLMLFTGDAGVQQERDLLKHYPSLKVDIMKLGHHGSNTSTDADFIKKIEAKVAIASANPRIYKHPHIDVRKTLFKQRVNLLETDKEGDIRVIFTILFDFIHTEGLGFAII